MSRSPMPQGWQVRVRGQVQGVGFRPFIWGLAQARGLRGHVFNDPEGVLIRLLATPEALAELTAAIQTEAPPLARVIAVESAPFSFATPPEGFAIHASEGQGAQTRVTPDAATCPACLAETMAAPDGTLATRRAGYAFTNCTHCGPRFSILKGLPYDRAQTTMAPFALCPACRAEYENPADRRFHAQPVACPDCGPQIWFERGDLRLDGPQALPAALAVLQQGGILAVKGLGGFHLACNAHNPEAIALLRQRKARPAKPLAVMARLPQARALADLSPEAEAALQSPAAPVVLAPSRGLLPESIAEALAPGIDALGLMLPYTPLHHLLLAGFGGPLVMTSANRSGAPQVIDNETARADLAQIADALLLHDRAIARRLDDSVTRPPMVLRRARGLVPEVTPLAQGGADILALGGQMKGAICLLKGREALLSHHLGDLDDPQCYQAFTEAVADYTALFEHQPQAIAVDLHQGYRATQFGAELAARLGLPLVEVQHHHAHLAACLAENGWQGGAVAGIILDGTGAGEDGTLWGGELLLGDYAGFERLAHLAPAPLLGGEKAAREPWRNALARLDQAGLGAQADARFASQPRALLRQAQAAGLNAPLSSSAGRLFDAAAAILRLSEVQSYEGEAAMRLEALAGRYDGPELCPEGSLADPAPLIEWLCREDLAAEARGFGFHLWLARAFARPARALIEAGRAEAVALSGGCLQNALLARLLARELQGVPTLTHAQIPAGDGGLALGQAMVARMRQSL